MPIRWTSWRLYSLVDPDFKAQFVNEFGSQQGTLYDDWAHRLKNKLRTTWGYARADHSVWTDRKIQVSGIGSIDHVYDAWRGDWMSSKGDGTPYRLHPSLASLRGWIDPRDRSNLVFNGIPWKWFKSGFSWGYALFTIVSETPFDFDTEEEEWYVIRQTVGGLDNTYSDYGIGTVESSIEVSS